MPRYWATQILIISSRLHTCIMGNLSGVPAILIDTWSKKLSETYDELGGYPLPTIDPQDPSWIEQKAHQVDRVLEDRSAIVAKVNSAVAQASKVAIDDISELFSARGGPPASTTAAEQVG